MGEWSEDSPGNDNALETNEKSVYIMRNELEKMMEEMFVQVISKFCGFLF